MPEITKDVLQGRAMKGGGDYIVGGPYFRREKRFATIHTFDRISTAINWTKLMPREDGAEPRFVDETGRLFRIDVVETAT